LAPVPPLTGFFRLVKIDTPHVETPPRWGWGWGFPPTPPPPQTKHKTFFCPLTNFFPPRLGTQKPGGVGNPPFFLGNNTRYPNQPPTPPPPTPLLHPSPPKTVVFFLFFSPSGGSFLFPIFRPSAKSSSGSPVPVCTWKILGDPTLPNHLYPMRLSPYAFGDFFFLWFARLLFSRAFPSLTAVPRTSPHAKF